MEELDSPGEWFFDREARKIYLWPNGSFAEAFVATNLQTLINVKGQSQSKPITDINIFGLNVRDSAYTYLGDQNGGWVNYFSSKCVPFELREFQVEVIGACGMVEQYF